jgi:hypothetical protein
MDIPLKFPNVDIFGHPNTGGNLFTCISPMILKSLNEKQWRLTIKPIRRPDFELDELGSFKLGDFQDDTVIDDHVRINDIDVKIRYRLHIPPQIYYTQEATLWPSDGTVHTLNVRNGLTKKSLAFTKVGYGKTRSTVPCEDSRSLLRYKYKVDGTATFITHSSGCVLHKVYFEQNANQYFSTDMYIVHHDPHMTVTKALLPIKIVTNGRPKLVMARTSAASMTLDSSRTNEDSSIEIQDDHVLVRWSPNITVCAIFDHLVYSVWKFEVYRPKMHYTAIVSASSKRTFTWGKILDVPDEITHDFTASRALKCEQGSVSIDDNGMCVQSSNILGTWPNMPIQVQLRDGVVSMITLVTVDATPLLAQERMIEYPGEFLYKLPPNYIYTSKEFVEDHDGIHIPIDSPGTKVANIDYEVGGIEHSVAITINSVEKNVDVETIEIPMSMNYDVTNMFVNSYRCDEIVGSFWRNEQPILPPGLSIKASKMRASLPCEILLHDIHGKPRKIAFLASRSLPNDTSPVIVYGQVYTNTSPGTFYAYAMALSNGAPTFTHKGITFTIEPSGITATATTNLYVDDYYYIDPTKTITLAAFMPYEPANGNPGVLTMTNFTNVTNAIGFDYSISVPDPNPNASVTTENFIFGEVINTITYDSDSLTLTLVDNPTYNQYVYFLVVDDMTPVVCKIRVIPPISKEITMLSNLFKIFDTNDYEITGIISGDNRGLLQYNASPMTITLAERINTFNASYTATLVLSLPENSTATMSFSKWVVNIVVNVSYTGPIHVPVSNPIIPYHDGMIVLDSDNNAVETATVASGGILLKTTKQNLYSWYVKGPTDDQVLYGRGICIENVVDTKIIDATVGVEFDFAMTRTEDPDVKYLPLSIDPTIITVSTKSRYQTIVATIPGSFSTIYNANILITINVASFKTTWTCRAESQSDIYYVHLPIQHASYVLPDTVQIVETKPRSFLIKVPSVTASQQITLSITDVTGITYTILVTLVHLSQPLYTSESYTATINIAKALQMFQTSSVVFLKSNDIVILHSENTVTDNNFCVKLPGETYVGTTRPIAGVLKSMITANRTLYTPTNVDTELKIKQTYDVIRGNLSIVTYFDTDVPIVTALAFPKSAHYATFNGYIKFSTTLGKVIIPKGLRMNFNIGGLVSTFSPPLYTPSDNFSVELTARSIPDIVDVGSFSPPIWKLLNASPNTHISCDFNAQIYTAISPGLDAFTIVYWTTRDTITMSQCLVASVPIQTDTMYTLNTPITVATDVLTDFYIVGTELVRVELGETFTYGNVQITTKSPAIITIITTDENNVRCDYTFAWSTSRACGRLLPSF